MNFSRMEKERKISQVSQVSRTSLEEPKTDLKKWEFRQEYLNRQTLEEMKHEFFHKPHYFLSNLLLLSVQFFENFDREHSTIAKLFRDKELEYNDELLDHNRRVHFLGAHEETAASHALYHPRGVDYYEMIGPKQIFVMQDNVQLFPENDFERMQATTPYSEVEGAPTYRLCLEKSKRHHGYVRLRSVDSIAGLSRSNTYEDIYRCLKEVKENEPDAILDSRPINRKRSNAIVAEIHINEESTMKPVLTKQNSILKREIPSIHINDVDGTKPVQKQLSFKDLETEDFFSDIGEEETESVKSISPQPVEFDIVSNVDDTNSIVSCVELESKIDDDDMVDDPDQIKNDKIDEVVKDSSKLKDIELSSSIRKECFILRKINIRSKESSLSANDGGERRLYLSSERYRETFEDDFAELLKTVHKQELQDDEVHVRECSIITKNLYKNSLLIERQYTPALACDGWPDETSEWVHRERKTRLDRSGKTIYKWPNQRDIDDIHTSYGCTIVPMGYYNPTNPNRIMLIEWQYQFIRAEQTLMRSLGHQQIRLLFLVELMFRDHIPNEDDRALHSQHLRYNLFWLCEHNYRDWKEEKLAIMLRTYFIMLYDALSEGNLPHYFIRKINMLDNMKPSSVRIAQETVKRILDNLPMYIFHAIKRVRYKPQFYPTFDFDKLYPLISVKRYGLEQINPQLLVTQNDTSELGSDKEEDDEEKIMQMRYLAERRKRKMMARGKKITKKDDQPIDSVDLSFMIENLNDLRAERLLKIFLCHFVSMASVSNRYNGHVQSMKYLLYARNLLHILLDGRTCCRMMQEDVEELKELISMERNQTLKGVSHMLKYTHVLNEEADLRFSFYPPKKNWQLRGNATVIKKTDFKEETNFTRLRKEAFKTIPEQGNSYRDQMRGQ